MKKNKMFFYLFLTSILMNGNMIVYGSENILDNSLDKPSLLPMLPDDYLDLENRPVVLPMLPKDYLNLNNESKEYYINKEGYTVIKYDKNSLESTIQELGISFPEKLKVEGNARLTYDDWFYLNQNAVYLDLSAIRSEDDAIPMGAFENNRKLKRIKFPNNLERIDDNAFFDCALLEGGLNGNIEFPETLYYIGDGAFSSCISLKGDLILPDQINRIPMAAFSGCNALNGKLKLPSNLTIIDDYAFSGCNFTGTLNLPNSLRRIGNSSFEKCSNFSGDLVLPDNIIDIGISAFKNCSGFDGKLILPQNTSKINTSVFENCSGLSGTLDLPPNLIEIGKNAFRGCSGFNGELIMPQKLEKILDRAFQNCTGFSGNLFFQDSVSIIGNNAFAECSGLNGELILPPKKIMILDNAFENTLFHTVRDYSTLKDGNVLNVGSMFNGTRIFGFSSNQSLYENAKEENARWIELSEKEQWEDLVITYDNRYASLQEAIEDQVPLIEKYRIRDWLQKNIMIVTSDNKKLNSSDFAYLNQSPYLMRLDLTNAVCENNEIPINAFKDNQYLLMIKFPKDLKAIKSSSFDNCQNFIGGFDYKLILDPNVLEIGDYAFRNAKGIQFIENHFASLQSIGKDAFKTNADWPQIAYGYSDNAIYKKGVETNHYKWKEFGLFVEGFDKEIIDGEYIDIEDLYDASYKNESITGVGDSNKDLSELPLGENDVQITVSDSNLQETVNVQITVKPNDLFFKVKKIDKIIKLGETLSLEDLFKATYRDKDILFNDLIYVQKTDHNLAKLPIGKHKIEIDVNYKGLERTIYPTVVVKSPFDFDEEKPKTKVPLVLLNPSQRIVSLIKLNPALITRPFILLEPSIQINLLPEIEVPTETPEIETPIKKEDTLIKNEIEKPESNSEEQNSSFSNPSKGNSSYSVSLSNNLLKWIELTPSIPVQRLENLEINKIEVPQETISEEMIIKDEVKDPTNNFEEEEKTFFPNISKNTFILLSSSVVFLLIVLVLVIISYINKKRKEKDHE